MSAICSDSSSGISSTSLRVQYNTAYTKKLNTCHACILEQPILPFPFAARNHHFTLDFDPTLRYHLLKRDLILLRPISEPREPASLLLSPSLNRYLMSPSWTTGFKLMGPAGTGGPTFLVTKSRKAFSTGVRRGYKINFIALTISLAENGVTAVCVLYRFGVQRAASTCGSS